MLYIYVLRDEDMGLEELTFDVEGVKVHLKLELHKYHNHAEHDPFIGLVPVRVEYVNSMTKEWHTKAGNLGYDTDKGIFITAQLFVPKDYNHTDHHYIDLLKKYAKGMTEVSNAYNVMLRATHFFNHLNKGKLITEKHFYPNSQGEWKDIGDWLGVYSEKELRKMADAVK